MNSYLAAIAHRMKPCHDCGGEADPELYEWVEDEPRKSDYPQRTISSERWRCRKCYDAWQARGIVVKLRPTQAWHEAVAAIEERERRAREQLF